MTIGGDVLYTGGSDNSIQMWSIQDFSNINSIKVRFCARVCVFVLSCIFI